MSIPGVGGLKANVRSRHAQLIHGHLIDRRRRLVDLDPATEITASSEGPMPALSTAAPSILGDPLDSMAVFMPPPRSCCKTPATSG